MSTFKASAATVNRPLLRIMPHQKLENVSVCIPARNEAKNIESLLKLVLSIPAENCEILVGINGCTDNTEQIVDTLARSDTRLKTVKSEPGKAYAVNALMKASQHDTILFMDADVRFERDAPGVLVDFLRTSEFVAACADREWIVESSNALFYRIKKLWYTPPRVSTEMGLMGAMYAVRKGEFIRALNEKGYFEIPPVINEDHFLHLVLEDKDGREKKWSNVPKAVVSIRPSGFLDVYRRTKRIIKGDLQLMHEHQSLGLGLRKDRELSSTGRHETPEEKRRRRIELFKELTLGEKFLMIFIFPLRRMVFPFIGSLARHNAKREYRRRINMVSWVPTQTDR